MRFDASGSSGEPHVVAEINVTPLTDIFLVLLVIFMVTSTALVRQGESVDLPGASGGRPLEAGIEITATADGRIEVDGEPADMQTLAALLRARIGDQRQPPVIVRGDRAVSLERLVQILTAARTAGAARVAIATRPEGSEGS